MIRTATLDDVPKIVEIWTDFLLDHDNIVLEQNPNLKPYIQRKESASENYKEFITKNIGSGKGVIFVAEADKNIVGYVLAYIQDEIPIYIIENIGYISDLYVKGEYRGRGISSRLKDKAIEWFKAKGMEYMSLKVYADNKHALSVYRKWGFIDFHVEMRKRL